MEASTQSLFCETKILTKPHICKLAAFLIWFLNFKSSKKTPFLSYTKHHAFMANVWVNEISD